MAKFDKYKFYEESVQSPEEDVELFANLYRIARNGKEPLVLREDFCGTFRFACEWVKKGPDYTAEALDLDPEPLAYGRKNHYPKLRADQKRRLNVLKKNVISVSKKKADLIVANNFSFYIFKDRKVLLEYFKACQKSLKPGGMLIVEMVGGPGFIEKNTERRTIRLMGKPQFRYIWDQRKFNPVTRDALYSIHFHLLNGKKHNHVFTYDWRIWTMPEVRDVMRDAGFSETCAFWEKSHRGEATGEFMRTEKGDNDWTWLSYVGAVK